MSLAGASLAAPDAAEDDVAVLPLVPQAASMAPRPRAPAPPSRDRRVSLPADIARITAAASGDSGGRDWAIAFLPQALVGADMSVGPGRKRPIDARTSEGTLAQPNRRSVNSGPGR